MWTDGQRDRHDEADINFSQFSYRAKNYTNYKSPKSPNYQTRSKYVYYFVDQLLEDFVEPDLPLQASGNTETMFDKQKP